MSIQFELKLADVGEGVVEAEIVSIFFKTGDTVKEDDPLIEVMTDKVTLEIPSPINGTLSEICVEEGDTVAVGSLLMSIDIGISPEEHEVDLGTDGAIENASSGIQPAGSPENVELEGEEVFPKESTAAPLAAPATRRRATELGVSLDKIAGTGEMGRITIADVENYVSATQTDSPEHGSNGGDEVTEIKITGVRRKIATQVKESKSRIPHFTYVEECDLTELKTLREQLNSTACDEQKRVSLLPFFMRAIALLQTEFPMLNARYDDDNGILRLFKGVHTGIATQTDLGLVVPVVRNVESLDIWQCARELQIVSDAAKNQTAKPNQLNGSTITITSLGALGGITTTPVVNYPEVAIVAPNKMIERAVVVDGNIVIRTMMNISASFDHRIIDGYDAARFIQRLKDLIEAPDLLLRLEKAE